MRLMKLKLTNFRCYKTETVVNMDYLVVFVGKNDSGKSALFDALDIFFEGKVAPDKDDACVHGTTATIRITCVFDDFPSELVIDTQHPTDLATEHILNSDGLLEIAKIYNCDLAKPKLQDVFARANHPTIDGYSDLLSLNNSKLKLRAGSLGVDLSNVNQTINTELRRTIWNHAGDLLCQEVDVALKAEAAKAIWDQLKKHLPVFALFKSDRPSTDQDAEAQDPMKAAIKEAIREQENILNSIAEKVKEEVQEIADRTVEKVREMNPELASQLTPRVSHKNWDSLFSVSLTGDDDIPINKRGSGTRRLFLLNFFRAKAEKAAEGSSTGVIYAIEEPETSQHPHNQVMLINALEDLSERPECQVLLTTHTPVLARRFSQSALRLVTQDGGRPIIRYGSEEDTLKEIVDSLGVLPDHNILAFWGIEGRNDINFLRIISRILHEAGEDVPNLEREENEGRLVFIPLGGSSLDLWVSRLQGFSRPEFYLKEVRQELIDAVSEASKAHSLLDESFASSSASFGKADDDLEEAQSDSTEADTRRKKAESLLKLRRADFDYFNNRLHLEQLRERKGRLDRAREEATLAEELLAENSVDEGTLKDIQRAERSLITAQAKLETGAPNVLLKGLDNLDLQIDGEPTTISKDQKLGLSVSDRIRVTIPGSLQMDVTAGSSSADLSKRVEEAQEVLDTVCKDAGVSNADEAKQSYDVRREARQSVERLKEIEKDNLRDLTYEELERKVTGLGKSVPAYPAARISEPKLPKNLESAKKDLRTAETWLEEANETWEEARAKLDAARQVRTGLGEQHQKVRVKLGLKTEELKRFGDELTRSRKMTTDNDLDSNHSKSTELVHAEEERVESAKINLDDKEPDRVRALAETAKDSLGTVQKRREAVQKDNTEVRTHLKIFGEEGLHEKLHSALSHLNHIRQENAAMLRRAQATRLLYETMREEREKARRAYVAPLKEKIERLGRLVFNSSFEVDVTEDLSVSGRAMDGSTVPFESLSGGTKEQISLISRLACAMTVSKDVGSSLIIDDALGYTDPERLKLMGVVLAKAGKQCQIIILTCVPDRYNNVGQATVVRLG